MDDLTRAFPAVLTEDVLAVSEFASPGAAAFEQYPARVRVLGEELAIPYRVSCTPPLTRWPAAAGQRRRLILDCLETRDPDGFRRQDACGRIIGSREPWVTPYVLRLLGEYVDEISRSILRALEAQSAFTWDQYALFVRENEQFVALTEARAVSYWGCNHRGSYPLTESPALQTLQRLRQGTTAPA